MALRRRSKKGRKPLKKRTKSKVHPNSIIAMNKGRDRSFANAPRTENGKIVPGYSYKRIIDAYKEHGVEPKQALNPRASKPLFVKEPRVKRLIIKLIKRAYPHTTVCRAVGIDRNTFMDWLRKGQANLTPEYADFYKRVCKAEAQGEMRILNELQKHEKYDWRSSAWQLERRWPEHWARRDADKAAMRVNGQITVTHKHELSKRVSEDPEALELARKMIDGSEHGYKDITPENEGV